MPLDQSEEIGKENPMIRGCLDKIHQEPNSYEGKIAPPFNVMSNCLLKIPERFRGRF
jgi:hypothetical protein